MTKFKTIRLVMVVAVTDEKALAAAAREKALGEGWTEWDELRYDAGSDLEMLINPLVGTGFRVLDVRIEEMKVD